MTSGDVSTSEDVFVASDLMVSGLSICLFLLVSIVSSLCVVVTLPSNGTSIIRTILVDG